MTYTNPLFALYWALALFVAVLVMVELGRWLGGRRIEKIPESAYEGIGAVEGALFGLLALLIAFTFGGAASRFEARRDLITREANAVGTAFMRLDLLMEPARTELRQLFRHYLDARLEYHKRPVRDESSLEFLMQSEGLKSQVWARANVACQEIADWERGGLVLTPINEMFDAATARKMALLNHPPIVIFAMLFILTLVSGIIVGHSIAVSKQFLWIHGFSFALLTSMVVFVILDLEFPRGGLIRVDAADVVLVEVRERMK